MFPGSPGRASTALRPALPPLIALAALLVLALGLLPLAGGADERRPQDVIPAGSPADAELAGLLEAGRRRVRAAAEQRATPEARADRAASRTRHRGLDAGEARELAVRTFGDSIFGGPIRPLAGGAAVDFVNERAASFRGRDGRRRLLLATFPLAADGDGDRPLDLTLEATADDWRPAAAATPLRVARDAVGGFEVGDRGLAIRPAGVASTRGSVVDDGAVFYDNVSRDTDFAVRPLPTGAETFHVLRSQESPELLALDVDGADTLDRGARGVRVLRGGRTIARIGDVVAVDADGHPVDADLRIEGTSLAIAVPHRAADLKYPVVVDPVVDTFDWEGCTDGACSLTYAGWSFYHDLPAGRFNQATGSGPFGPGLYINGPTSPTYFQDSDQALWVFDPPGDAEVDALTLKHIDQSAASAPNACVYAGVLSAPSPGRRDTEMYWDKSPYSACGASVLNGSYSTNVAGDRPGNRVGFGTNPGGPGTFEDFVQHLGYAGITLVESTLPYFQIPTWQKTPAAHVKVLDEALGIKEATVTNAPRYVSACDGTHNGTGVCPASVEVAGTFPDGSAAVSLWAKDAVGNTRTSSGTVRVDTAAPVVQVAGGLWDRRGDALTGRASVTVTASDPPKAGSPAGTPTSGVSSIDLLVDGALDKSVPGAQGEWYDSACPTCTRTKSLDFDPLDQAPGKRTLTVVVRDHAGNETRQSWDVNSSPELPVASAIGHAGRGTAWMSPTSGASVVLDAAARIPGIRRLGLERTDGTWSGGNRDESCTRSSASAPCSTHRRETLTYGDLASTAAEGRFDVRGVAKDPAGTAPSPGDAARPRGLEAYFFDTIDLTGRPVPRTISQVQGHWDTAAPDPRIHADTWSARIVGMLKAPASGSYTFATRSDDGVRVWVNGTQVVNNWVDQQAVSDFVGGTLTLDAGVAVPVTVEYYDQNGPAQVDLKWRKPGATEFEDIPHTAFSRPANGWRAEFYASETPTGTRVALGREATVDQSYVAQGPVFGMAADGWSIRWATRLRPTTTGDYRFRTTYNDGAQLTVDGRVIFDDLAGTRSTDAVHTSAPVRLVGGREHDALLKLVDRSGDARIRLEWQRDNGAWETVPVAQTVYPVDGRTAAWNVGVDRTAPSTELSGTLYEVRGTVVGHRAFPLRVRAYEGQPVNGAPPPHDTSGARKIDVYTVAEDPSKPPAEWQRVRRAGIDSSCGAGNCERVLDWTMNTSQFPKMPHRVIVAVEDQVGNRKEESFKVTIDERPPAVTLSGPATDPAAPGTVLHVDSDDRFDGADGSGVRSVEIKLDGVRHHLYTRDCPLPRCPQTWSLDHDFGTAVGNGRREIEVVVTDDAANSRTATATAYDPRKPINRVLPQIAEPDGGATPVGAEVETTDGEWDQLLAAPNHRFEYQWLSCDAQGANCSSIPGATAKRYRITPDQLGNRLRAAVTAVNTPNGPERRSEPAVSPASRQISPDVADPILLEPEHTPPLPTDWVDDHRAQVKGTAVDVGLGLHRMELTEPLVPADQTRSQRFKAVALSGADCDGTITAMCPPAGSQTFEYRTGPYREGYVASALEAVDAAERRSGKKSWTLKVDHTPPDIAFTGAASTYAGGAITTAGTYPLTVRATDGVRGGAPHEQRSGVASLELLVSKDEGQFASRGVKRFDDCTGDSCPGGDGYTVDTAELGEGLHAVKAIAKDRLYDRVPDELKHRHIRESVMRFYVDLERPFLDAVAHDPNPPTDWVHAQPLSVTGTASDDGTGVHRFVLTRPAVSGSAEVVSSMGCQLSVEAHLRCPQTGASRRIDYNTVDVAEGDGVPLSFKAVDAVGRESDPNQWTLKVDHTPPSTPSDVTAAHDPDRSRALVSWAASDDPLGTGAPGSGVAHYTYQVRRAGGEWSAVQTASGPFVALEGFAPGETFSFRVRAVDRVGLVSGEREESLAMGDAAGAPQLTLSGRLWSSAGGTVLPGGYGLGFSAADGDGSGIRRLVLRVDGVLIDAAEQTCSGCDMSEAFWFNTADLSPGSHVITATAFSNTDVMSRRRWGVTANPRRTDFGFSPSVTLEELETAVAGSGADWFEVRHRGSGLAGGLLLGHEAPSAAFTAYREDVEAENGQGSTPQVSGVALGGDVPAEALGAIADRVTSRKAYDPGYDGDEPADDGTENTGTFDDDTFNGDEAADAQGVDNREPTAFAAASEDSDPKFSPTFGAIRTSDADSRRRRIANTMTFGKDALPDDEDDSPFERSGFPDHGYEHDFKLFGNFPAGGRHPFCTNEKENFWAQHKGITWFHNFPGGSEPYLDTHLGDPCNRMDLTVGVEFPLDLKPNVTYKTVVKARKGDKGSQDYQLQAQKTVRAEPCPGPASVCSDTASGGERDLLVGAGRGNAPECRRWRKNMSSRSGC